MKINTVVIGAGPGGYVAAIRLAQLGIETLVIEKGELGGVCLNVGCIPSKALIHASKEYYKASHDLSKMGISCPEVSLDFSKLISWKDGIVKKLTRGIGGLLKGNGVKVLQGTARFDGKHRLKVLKADGTEETIEFEHCILATGSRPATIPGFEIDQDSIVDSTGALSFEKRPDSLLVVGGGYIGLELGMTYARLGTQVTMVEFLDSILAGFDKDVITLMNKKLKSLRVQVLSSTRAQGFEKTKNGVQVKLETGEKIKTVEAEKVCVCVGRTPNTQGLNLARAGIEASRQGFIPVNEKLQTSMAHIFAIGDLVEGPMLAHKASKEGEVAAEVIAGKDSILDIRQIPSVVFSDPEIAHTGLSEKDASDRGLKTKVAKFPYAALGRSLTTNETEGFAKIISDKEDGEILGITLVGAHASELISEAALSIEMCSFLDDVSETVHPHPTFGEILMEATKAASGKAIHILNR